MLSKLLVLLVFSAVSCWVAAGVVWSLVLCSSRATLQVFALTHKCLLSLVKGLDTISCPLREGLAPIPAHLSSMWWHIQGISRESSPLNSPEMVLVEACSRNTKIGLNEVWMETCREAPEEARGQGLTEWPALVIRTLFSATKLKNVLFAKPRRLTLRKGHRTDDLSAGEPVVWQQEGSTTGTAHHICHCFSCQPTRKTGCSRQDASIPSYKTQPPASAVRPGCLLLGQSASLSCMVPAFGEDFPFKNPRAVLLIGELAGKHSHCKQGALLQRVLRTWKKTVACLFSACDTGKCLIF